MSVRCGRLTGWILEAWGQTEGMHKCELSQGLQHWGRSPEALVENVLLCLGA